MATSRVQTGLRLDEQTYKKILFIATKESRSLNNQIEFAIKSLIANYEKEHGEIPVSD